MTTESFESNLLALFTAVHPDDGFEDRLVNATRQMRLRLTIAPPIYKAAIAAAAVLVVGIAGYSGNRFIISHAGARGDQIQATVEPMPLAEDMPSSSAQPWEFAGGSNATQNWIGASTTGKSKNKTYHGYNDQLAGAVAPGGGVGGGGFGGGKPSLTFGIDKKLSINRQLMTPAIVAAPPTPPDYYFRDSDKESEPALKSLSAPAASRAKVNDLSFLPSAAKDASGATDALGRLRVAMADRSDAVNSESVAVTAMPALPATPVTPPLQVPPDGSTTAPADQRKIIRTGNMEFEVERFDSAQTQITKIVGELGGFVGTTDSQKLPNGKVRGSIAVRIPPEHLDALVLSLRALGDLKSQQISAMDVTKEYTDLQSELVADRAMQERLLELIHNGKGSIKDLLAAENELGSWRGKIEKAEGAIRYYNSQVALSTLNITLSERDIQTAATAVEKQTADVGIEAEDVEHARDAALKSIEGAKGRIIEAELKHYDAGQLAARLVADVPPESATAVIDQLKLLGKVARLEVHRQQTDTDGTTTGAISSPVRTEKKPTRLLISIYNLANIAPRQTTTVNLAATDVETAYAALITAIKAADGRVVTSNIDRGDPVKATASLVLEVSPQKFESAMATLHAQGDVLKLSQVENPDTQNSTQAKQGLTVQLISLASVPAREAVQQSLAVTDVSAAYQSILAATQTLHARVLSAQLNEQDRQNVTADLELDVPRAQLLDFDKSLETTGATIARTATRAAEAEGTVDSKISLRLSVTSSDHLPPRESTRLQIEVLDVDKSAADAQAMAVSTGGRVVQATVAKDHGHGRATVVLDLPLAKAGEALQQIRSAGALRGIDTSRDAQAPTGSLAHAQISIEFVTTDSIVADQTGPWASIRQGLSTSIMGLMWSLQWVVVGLCLIGPWVGIAWVGWKIWGRRRSGV